MAIGRTNAGGGGTSLNFKVVGGTTQPTSPKENTIWVNTDVAIPSWAFSTTEPGSPAAGMVWFSTGTSSTAEFNALKKNDIQVYPSSANQYLGGQWVGVEAYIYKSGVWVQFSSTFDGYLFNYGSVNEGVTGGWVTNNVPHASGYGDYPTAASQSDGSIKLTMANTARSGMYVTKKKIDLSKYSKITFKGYTYDYNGYTRAPLQVMSAIGSLSTQNVVAQFYKNSRTVETHTIDVSSLTGSYYIGFRIVFDGEAQMCSLKIS